MDFLRYFKLFSTKGYAYSSKKHRKRYYLIRWAIFAAVIIGLFFTCKRCAPGESSKPVVRVPPDVSGFSVVFMNDEAILYWTDPDDFNLDHIEISWEPDGKESLHIAKGIERYIIPGIEEGKVYSFTVQAVDKWKNKSALTESGTGLFFRQKTQGIKGTLPAGQAVLSWTNPAAAHYDHIEITWDSHLGKPLWIPRGVHSKTISALNDDLEYTFHITAVNNQGQRTALDEIGIFIPDHAESPLAAMGRSSGGQVMLVWKNPINPEFDHIEIIYGDSGESFAVIAGDSETTAFTGLSDAVDYEFTVYAVDASGLKRPLTEINLLTVLLPSFNGRDAELMLVKSYPVEGQITLNWEDPDMANMDHIAIMYEPDSSGELVRAVPETGTMTFHGLFDYTEYVFLVYAVDADNNNRVITGVTIATPQIPPLVAKPSAGSLTLVWNDPANAAVDRIEVVYSPGGSAGQIFTRGIESNTFSNLRDDTEYTFTVFGLDTNETRRPIGSARFFDPAVLTAWQEAALPEKSGEIAALNWKAAANSSFGESAVFSLAFGIAANGTPRWVAGGGEGKIAYSSDYGLNWRQAADSTFGYFAVNAVAYGNGRWVAVGKNGKMAWSNNAIVWNAAQKKGFTAANSINAAAFGSGRWVAGGSDGLIMFSDDNGLSWNKVNTDVFGKSDVNTVAYHEGRWLAGGAAGKIAWSDNNGQTWTAVENSTFRNSAISVIVYDKERWMAGGYAPRAASSKDGITWQTLPRPFYMLCLGFNGYRWIAGGQDGRIAWSADGGETWITDEAGHDLFDRNWVQAIAIGRTPGGGRRWLSGGQNGKIIYADE